MDIARQSEIRLATWLCEVIGDTIKRYQWVIEEGEKSLITDEAQAAEERKKQADPILGKYANPGMYEGFVTGHREHIKDERLAIDQLLTLLKSAQDLKKQAIEFWEGQNKRWQ